MFGFGFPELLLLFFAVLLLFLLWGAWHLVLRIAEALGAAWARGAKREDSPEKPRGAPGLCLLAVCVVVGVVGLLLLLVVFTHGSHVKPFVYTLF